MFVQVVVYGLPHWIKDELDTFTPRDLSRRNKVAVSCDEDDGINLLFECECRDVDADAHIHAFLSQTKFEIIRIERSPRVSDLLKLSSIFGSQHNRGNSIGSLHNRSVEDMKPVTCTEELFSNAFFLDLPTVLIGHLAEAKCKLTLFSEMLKQLMTELGLIAFSEVNLLI